MLNFLNGNTTYFKFDNDPSMRLQTKKNNLSKNFVDKKVH